MNSRFNASLLGAAIWKDGATVSDVRRSQRTVTARDVLTLHLSSVGGAVVAIDP